MSGTDPYTAEHRLCDDHGRISDELVEGPKNPFDPDLTYRKQLNYLRAHTGLSPYEGKPFLCTGSMHLAGGHIQCTNPIHVHSWNGRPDSDRKAGRKDDEKFYSALLDRLGFVGDAETVEQGRENEVSHERADAVLEFISHARRHPNPKYLFWDYPSEDEDDEAVHGWFELSYSNYQVIPRTLMQSMPGGWQRRMVACLEELREAFGNVEQAPGYEVRACRWQSPIDTDHDTLRKLGFYWIWDVANDGRTYFDRDGNEVDAWRTCVPVPVTDPIPHYDRGRARVEPYGDQSWAVSAGRIWGKTRTPRPLPEKHEARPGETEI